MYFCGRLQFLESKGIKVFKIIHKFAIFKRTDLYKNIIFSKMTNHKMKTINIKHTLFFLISISFLAFIIRLYRVDFLSIWVDEIVHVKTAKAFLFNNQSLITDDNNGIFTTFIITLFYKLFGISEFTTRIGSVILGASSIPLAYILAQRLFKKDSIAMIAAFLMTFSLYLIFWSRLGRMYATFQFTYLALLLIFHLFFEPKEKAIEAKNILQRVFKDLNWTWFFPFILILLLSIFSHRLSLFFIPSILVYGSFITIFYFFGTENHKFINKYALLLYSSILLLIITLTGTYKHILGFFIPQEHIAVFVPSLLSLEDGADPAKLEVLLSIYINILVKDYIYLYLFAFVGVIISFRLNKKNALYLLINFLVPFILMSLVFNSMASPRYLIYIYPLFLIASAVGIDFIAEKLVFYVDKIYFINKLNLKIKDYVVIACILILLSPFKDIWKLIDTKEHGKIIDMDLTHASTSNWREATNYVKRSFKKSDIIMSTNQWICGFYLNSDSVLAFRQLFFDRKSESFVLNQSKNSNRSANSFEEFMNTIKTYPRGWILADYYLYNQATDPRIFDYITQNMKYHFDATADGNVQVFSWEHGIIEPKKVFFYEVGRYKSGKESDGLIVNLDSNIINRLNDKVKFKIDAEGIDNKNEMMFFINLEHSHYVDTCKNNNRDTLDLVLSKTWLKEGKNDFLFIHNPQLKENSRKGACIYNLYLDTLSSYKR